MAGKDIFKKIKVPKALVPKKVQTKLEISLDRAHISFSATEWIGMFSIIAIVMFILGAVVKGILVGLALFIASFAMMFMVPNSKAAKRTDAIEDSMPDALHHMSVAIRTGLVLESVIQEVSEAEYGPLSEEFAQVMVEMRKGRPLKSAMLAFAQRSGSKNIQRSMYLLLEGVDSGGPISDVMEEVSSDMKAVKEIQRERKTLTSQQVSFLGMASLIAGPFVMGVVGALPTIMVKMSAGLGPSLPMDEINSVVTALTFYVFAQGMAGGLMIGVIMYGDLKKGAKLMLPLGVIAYIVFRIVKFIMPGMLSAMGG